MRPLQPEIRVGWKGKSAGIFPIAGAFASLLVVWMLSPRGVSPLQSFSHPVGIVVLIQTTYTALLGFLWLSYRPFEAPPGADLPQVVAKFFALQWHHDGLGAYMVFEGRTNHGDAAIVDAQSWLAKHFSVADPVEEVIRRSGLSERSFNRRFSGATGHAPLAYVQQLRVADAKRRLERTEASVEEIGWHVGYEDPTFFRRLFKRLTGLTPGRYRKQFQVPDYVTSV